MKPRLLMIEDDHRLAAMVVQYLAASGMQAEVCGTAAAGLAALAAASGTALRHAGAAVSGGVSTVAAMQTQVDAHAGVHAAAGSNAPIDTQFMTDADEATPFDLVILDLMLPDADGFDVCRQIRLRSSVPVIMLTARGDPMDRVVGLELGADDYLPKPFEPRELVARVRAVLRRHALAQQAATQQGVAPLGSAPLGSAAQGSAPQAQADRTPAAAPHAALPMAQGILRFGPLDIDRDRRQVRLHGQARPLTAHQFELLVALAQRAGRVLSREQLMDLVRGEPLEAFDRSIDVHVARIRAAIEDDPRQPRRILTVRGAGYVFARDDDGDGGR